MSDNSESFRNDLMLNLTSILPPEQLKEVMNAVDSTLADYEISRKEMAIITSDGFPIEMQWYLASKNIENLSSGTLEQYHYRLTKFFSAVRKPLKDITTNDIRGYLYQYKQNNNVSDSTIDCVRRVLNSFFAWLVDNDYLIKNPVAKISPIKFQQHERVPLTPYELELMRWYCKTLREKALVDFLFSTGCRVSEVSNVLLTDINWDERSVLIRHGKGDKRRTVFFNAEAELSMRKYLESNKHKGDYLFSIESNRCNGVRMSARSIQALIREIWKRTNIQKECSPHVLRHTFATFGIRNKIPLERLQALMGHSKPETTLIYAKLDKTDLQREHQRIYA